MAEWTRAVTPGLVNAHHRLYTSLSRYLPDGSPGGGTRAGLEASRWRIEDALDVEMIEWAAKLGALEAIESGTTAIIDHHCSPNAIGGSLNAIAQACAEVGVRVSCSYAVSDRSGDVAAAAGLVENDEFLESGAEGMVGLQMAMLCSPETIDAAMALADRHGVGIHVQCAESMVDSGPGIALARQSDVDWILASGVNLADGVDFAGTVVHTPRSDLYHGVGYAAPDRFVTTVALGTGAMHPAMLDELATAWLLQQHHGGPESTPETSLAQAWAWLEAGHELMRGAEDDIVVWSLGAAPDGSLDPRHGALGRARAVEVVIDGHKVLEDGTATRVDAEEIRAKAKEQAARLAAVIGA